MAYMGMQRYTTAIREGYADRTDVSEQLANAAECRVWLESLAIDPAIRAELIEPIRAVEEALADLERSPGTYLRDNAPS